MKHSLVSLLKNYLPFSVECFLLPHVLIQITGGEEGLIFRNYLLHKGDLVALPESSGTKEISLRDLVLYV